MSGWPHGDEVDHYAATLRGYQNMRQPGVFVIAFEDKKVSVLNETLGLVDHYVISKDLA